MVSKKQTIFVIGVVAILVTAGIAALFLSPEGKGKGDTDKMEVVTAFYPLSYMVEAIGGDKVKVSSLVPGGTEGHDWSPSTGDILKAARADMFIYNGAGMDDLWVENQLLPAIDTGQTTVVKSTEGMTLSESTAEDTRFFVFDNDNNRTLVYDSSGGRMVLIKTLPFDLDVTTSYSGYFDPAVEATNSAGYTLLFIPGPNNVTVLNTGLHGDHFHDPTIVTIIPAGKPLHAAVSSDNKYVAFALDGENAVLVIDVNAPANYYKVSDVAGSSTSNHATVVFDGDDRLYYADMRETGDTPQNLMVIDAKTGNTIISGGFAGNSPHGGVYSEATGKVYLDCSDGIAVVGKNGHEKTIPYAHDGDRLSRSWISGNGTWMISYVKDESRGLAYSSIVAYDLVNDTLVAEIPLEVKQKAEHGWPASILLSDGRTVAISDPATGTVVLVDVASGKKTVIDLEVQEPVSMRLVEDASTHDLWVMIGNGLMYRIEVGTGFVAKGMEMELESSLGQNFVLSAVTTSTEGGNSDEDGHSDEPLYDPHTWISPFTAKQQAKVIYDALVKKDPGNSTYYTERWEELDRKLADLDERYKAELAETSSDMIFVSHSAYGYLAERYGFTQKGVIGISGDEQPSVATLKYLVNDMIEHEIYVVYYDPAWTDKYVKSLKSSVETLSGHTVQVLKLYLLVGDVDGLDFLGQMEENLETLKTGLGAG